MPNSNDAINNTIYFCCYFSFSTGFSMGRVIKSIAAKFNTKFELMEVNRQLHI